MSTPESVFGGAAAQPTSRSKVQDQGRVRIPADICAVTAAGWLGVDARADRGRSGEKVRCRSRGHVTLPPGGAAVTRGSEVLFSYLHQRPVVAIGGGLFLSRSGASRRCVAVGGEPSSDLEPHWPFGPDGVPH